jgi:hypothetical protein
VFPAPANVTTVRFTTDELLDVPGHRSSPTSHTWSSSTRPTQWCIESKSLKLYLWGFRDRAVFAEALAAEIAGEVMTPRSPRRDGDAHPAPEVAAGIEVQGWPAAFGPNRPSVAVHHEPPKPAIAPAMITLR